MPRRCHAIGLFGERIIARLQHLILQRDEWLQRHPGPARYNWSNIPKVNAAARLALEDRLRHPSRLLWLPAASISATRIDAHPANAHPATDCLHYCMPGPVDAWTHALFHLLATKPLN